MLEADLHLQAVTIPKDIIGLSTKEYGLCREGLLHVKDTDREALIRLRAIARKSYTNANKTMQEKEADDLTK